MFKKKKKPTNDFDFNIEIAPVDEEEYGVKEKSKLHKITTVVLIPFAGVFLLGGAYAYFTGGDEVKVAPKETQPQTEQVSTVKTTEDIEKSKEKTKPIFADIPKDYVVYTNGFLSIATLTMADWVVSEKTQESMNDISPFLKEGVFDWKKAKLKKPAYIVDFISPKVDKPIIMRSYISNGKTDGKFVAKLFSVSAKPIGSMKSKKVKFAKKNLSVQEYNIKDFNLKIKATKMDKKIGNVTVSTVLLGEQGKAYTQALEGLYTTGDSFKQYSLKEVKQ